MIIRLSDLEPGFYRRLVMIDTWRRLKQGVDPSAYNEADFEQVTGPREHREQVEHLAEADGVAFLCPKCYFDEPVGPVGTHSVICWFVGRVPDDVDPRPGRWVPAGSGLVDLTFVGPNAASVQITGGCNAHFYVKHGTVELL